MSRALRYVLLFVGLIAIAGLILFFGKQPALVEIAPPEEIPSNSTSTQTNGPTPSVNASLKDKNTILFEWSDLPADTAVIKILRTPLGKNLWNQWKSLNTGGNANGSAEVTLDPKDDLNAFFYYFQAISGNGDPLYTSPGAQPQTGTGSGTSTPQTPIGGFNLAMAEPSASSTPPGPGEQFNQANTATSTNQTPGTQFNQSNTSTYPTATSTPTSTQTTIITNLPTSTVTFYMKGTFYAPDGTPRAIGVQDADFWAIYVDQSTEIGWQNLPSSTNIITIFRSATSSGPWSQIVEQTGIDPSIPGFIRILSGSAQSPYYYRMQARSGTTVIQNYGPLFLPPI